jgi:superfamily II DNA or RNA helicase
MSPRGFSLREYQSEALAALAEGWSAGERCLAVQLPTGMGKTVIFAHLARDEVRNGGRVLVLVHRDELVRQALDKLHGVAPDMRLGVMKAERNESDADVVVGSVQTLGRKGSRKLADLPTDHFSVIIVDEAHHAVADSYQRILNHFPLTYVAGFSATLERMDSKGLGDVWQRVVSEKSIIWGIRKGYLANVRGKAVHVTDLDLGEDVKTSGGDYQEGSLGEALIAAGAPEVVAGAYLEEARAEDGSLLQGVAFWPTVDAAHEGARAMAEVGIKAEVITGTTPLSERSEIYARVAAGTTTVLSNCMVLTEGFDMPQLSCAVIARPTTSRSLYVQMVGRVLRTWPGKREALVLDVAGVSSRLRLASLADLSKTKEIKEGESLTEADDRENEETAAVPPPKGTVGTVSVADVELFAARSNAWLQTQKGYWFIPAGEWTVAVVPHDTLEITWDVWALYTGWRNRQPHRRIAEGMTLEYAMVWCEGEAEDLEPTIARRAASWRKRKAPPSEAQLRMAAGLRWPGGERLEVPEDVTKAELSDLISRVIASKVADSYTVPAHKPSELDD